MIGHATVTGRLDRDGRLVEAQPRLAARPRAAGGEDGGPLAIPQLAALARLATRLGIVISRPALAAEGDSDIELWVRAEPGESGVTLELTGWTRQAARSPAPAPEPARQADFLRASADWTWETDSTLRLIAVSPAAAAASGRSPQSLIGAQITQLFRLVEDEAGELPLLTAPAAQRRVDNHP